ncbi:TRAP transporter small permease [Vreelandella populi]|uniref:TRAP transporter small permease protein n=1 Tax=Vreelandella populi TaxID=2498858 RepID=A0A3S1E955_9GAMM|nr:TRAP transporter small permease [Halomonas populi]RUR35671.1 TRAP transporter small permease [Halomonas populi]RUR47862.1 TRAP transporter small permease [Halomonas populi]
MSHLLARIHRGLILFNGSLAGLAMVLIFLLVAGNAFARYTYGGSISWGEDTAIYLMIYGLMFGMAWAYLQDKHIGFDLIRRLLPPRWLRWQAVAIDLVVLAVGVGLMVSAIEFIAARGNRTSSSTGIPMWVFQTSMLMGGGLLSLSALVMGAQRLSGRSDGEPSP